MSDSKRGRTAVVMGLGRFGGGAAVVRHLARNGWTVIATDRADADSLASTFEPLRHELAEHDVRWHLGGHAPADFAAAELVVVNPAVPAPWDNALLATARAGGARITTEVALALELVDRSRVIAVTGSAGKSTTSAMIAHALERFGRSTVLSGNIGGSLLDHLGPADARTPESIVLELSSFMLHHLGEEHPPGPRAGVAVLTSLAANHLDWHGSLAHYVESKARIRDGQTPSSGDRFIAPLDDDASIAPACAALAASRNSTPWWRLDDETLDRVASDQNRVRAIDDALVLATPGAHNRRNAVQAVIAASAHLARVGSIEPDERPAIEIRLAELLADFTGLPHRLRVHGRARGVLIVDDSKSTTPEATLLAVKSFPDASRIHLVAGGFDKGADLAPIGALASTIAGVYAIGTTTETIAANDGVRRCETLARAIVDAHGRAEPGDVLLLSPGCASWDQFTDYEHRGEEFLAAVKKVFGSIESD